MSRRIDVELTSSRGDGTWTWRAAGARQPKGDLLESLLYNGAEVGDQCRVEAEFHIDGIEIIEVLAPKKKKERTDLLELKTRPLKESDFVTTQRVSKGGGRKGRDEGKSRGDRKGPRGDSSERRPRPDRTVAERPRPKRLRPRRNHRDALLNEIAAEHRPIAEQVVRDGLPGVRAAIKKQNTEAKEAGKPEVDATPIMKIAEEVLPKARLADWQDRADATLSILSEIDLRDLRSVVVASADIARTDETRALAEELRSGLDSRIEKDHAEWLEDLNSALSDGRVVRALRVSSRPVKAGSPLPPEVAAKLVEQASAALSSDTMQDRWVTVIDALALSPVRSAVRPSGIPAEPKKELIESVTSVADRIPEIAKLFGVDPSQVTAAQKRRRPNRRPKNNKPKNEKPKAEKPKADEPSATEAKVAEADPAANPTPVYKPDGTPGEKFADTPAADKSPASEDSQAETKAAAAATTEPDTPQEPTKPEAQVSDR